MGTPGGMPEPSAAAAPLRAVQGLAPVRTVQNLVRYEALFKLLDEIQSLQTIEEVAQRVARQWKYFANVACWRLVLPLPEGPCVIDGCRGAATVAQAAQLDPWDAAHLERCMPRLVWVSAAGQGASPPPPGHLLCPGVTQIQVLPFMRFGQCAGLLSVSARHDPFAEPDLKFIRTFGNCLTDQLASLRLRQHALAALEHRASRDGLTGILNRGATLAQLEARLAEGAATGQPLGIVLADLDGFKRVNDRHGHQAGDQMLVQVAQRMAALVPAPDCLGRVGGEEFLAVLAPCAPERLAALAEHLRRAVAQTPFALRTDAPLALSATISIGTAWCPAGGQMRADDLIRQADHALYRSKDAGRNRITAG